MTQHKEICRNTVFLCCVVVWGDTKYAKPSQKVREIQKNPHFWLVVFL